jgi:uncharacterized membrane protein
MKKPDYWIDIYQVLKLVDWEKKPDMKHRPLIYADRPIANERLKELWLESEGKPKRFAKLIESEHGIKEWEVEDRSRTVTAEGE